MTKFLGMEHSAGEMVDQKTEQLVVWDNYILHFCSDSPDAVGMVSIAEKIKANNFLSIVGCNPETLIEEIEIRSGSEVALSYVRSGKRMILSGISWLQVD